MSDKPDIDWFRELGAPSITPSWEVRRTAQHEIVRLRSALYTAERQRDAWKEEAEAGRKMSDHQYSSDPDSPNNELGLRLVDAYVAARSRTDALQEPHRG